MPPGPTCTARVDLHVPSTVTSLRRQSCAQACARPPAAQPQTSTARPGRQGGSRMQRTRARAHTKLQFCRPAAEAARCAATWRLWCTSSQRSIQGPLMVVSKPLSAAHRTARTPSASPARARHMQPAQPRRILHTIRTDIHGAAACSRADLHAQHRAVPSQLST